MVTKGGSWPYLDALYSPALSLRLRSGFDKQTDPPELPAGVQSCSSHHLFTGRSRNGHSNRTTLYPLNRREAPLIKNEP